MPLPVRMWQPTVPIQRPIIVKAAVHRTSPPVAEAADKPAPTAMEVHVHTAGRTGTKLEKVATGLIGILTRLGYDEPLPAIETPAGTTGLDAELAGRLAANDRKADQVAALVRKLTKHA